MKILLNNKLYLYSISFSLFFGILIIAGLNVIIDSSYEIGDFAANSLLIKDAINLSLLTGNYSRIGFNHPGPAILYVLAMGELFFHKIFGLVDYAISGQLIAVILYNSFWLNIIFIMFNRLTQSIVKSLFLIGTFILLTSLVDYQIFLGLWFPHLYFLPFAAFLVALSSFAINAKNSWFFLSLSTGFLINGHVSFIPIIFIIILCASSIFIICSSSDNKFFELKKYYYNNKQPYVYFILVNFLFLIPLIIETIINYPGPIGSYISFSQAKLANNFISSFNYISYFWGGELFFIFGFLTPIFILLIFCLKKFESFNLNLNLNLNLNYIFIFSVFFISSNLAFFFYIIRGIDNLDQFYIGIFYFSVPILFLSLSIYLFIVKFIDLKNIFILFLSIILFLLFFFKIINPISYASEFKNHEIPAAYNFLHNYNGGNRIVLNLDGSFEWPKVWSNVAGILAFSSRFNDNLLCINEGWHILFTKKRKCTNLDIISNKALFVYSSNNLDVSTIPVFTSSTLSFIKSDSFVYDFNKYYSVSNDSILFNKFLLSSGWSGLDRNFVWTDGSNSSLFFPIEKGLAFNLSLDLEAYLPNSSIQQSVLISINGDEPKHIFFNSSNNRKIVIFDNLVSNNNFITVNLKILTPLSPSSFNSGDTRKLGVALYGFELSRSH
jgi:hypothetical protein